jgi:6,7-dimethyl-8-ribityllumazine synthase
MSTALPARPRPAPSNKSHIAIVASIYNEQYSNALLQNTKEELALILPNTQLDIARVPGAFEIPVACELLLSSKNPPDTIIALGVIIQGQTKHAGMVAKSVTNSLQAMAIRHKKPVINEVLLVDDEKQAYARCMGATINRGREAARSALTMIELFQAMNQEKAKKHIAFIKK